MFKLVNIKKMKYIYVKREHMTWRIMLHVKHESNKVR
jgi:hypothetical protein